MHIYVYMYVCRHINVYTYAYVNLFLRIIALRGIWALRTAMRPEPCSICAREAQVPSTDCAPRARKWPPPLALAAEP